MSVPIRVQLSHSYLQALTMYGVSVRARVEILSLIGHMIVFALCLVQFVSVFLHTHCCHEHVVRPSFSDSLAHLFEGILFVSILETAQVISL